MAVSPKPFTKGPSGRRKTQAVSTAPTITRVDSNASRLPGGIPVTVYGTNFRKGPGGELPIVSFDGYAAAGGVPTADGTQITGVIVPPSIGVGGGTPIIGYVDVTVEVFGPDQTATLLSGFLYYTGQMTAIDPPYAPTSGGIAVIVKGASFIAASTFSFGGVPATSVIQIDDTHYSVVVPAHVAGYVDVVMTESGGGTFTLRNGFQYTTLTRGTDIRRFPGTIINKTLGGMTPDSATFSIDGQSHKPVAGEEISISDEVTLDELFDGIMMSADQVYEGQIDQLVWRCTASDFTYILNKYRPFGSYFLVSASEVVRDLMGKYAPSFNLDFVQTKLALISISLDGTRTMSEVLTAIAGAIGGGRWRLEGRALHFFNPPAPSVITIPAGETGTGADFTACTLAAGAAVSLGNSYIAGNYCIRVTFLYSNGLESRLGPTSNVIAFDGTKYFHITGVPVGLNPGGGITCIGRKLYYLRNADQLASGWTISDNVTTALDVIPVLHAFSSAGTITTSIGEPVTAPDSGTDGAFPATIPVTGSSLGMQIIGPYVTVRGSSNQGDYGYNSNAEYCTSLAVAGQPTQDDITQHSNFYQGGGFYINFQTALGFYQFSNTAIYADGGESLPTQWSVSVFLGQGLSIGFGQYRNYCAWWTTPQTFPLINGKKPVKFRIYIRCISLRPTIAGAAGGGGGSADIPVTNPTAQLLGEVPYFETPTGVGNIPLSAGGSALDTTGSVNSPSESFDFSIQPPQVANAVEQTYVWPNPDGPYLEDYDNPHDIDDDDEDLLHADSNSQPFVSTEDITQLRNRVKVFGASTITAADAAVGDSAVQIANPGIASVNGGKLLAANGVTLDYFSTSSPETSTSKNAALLLRTPLTQAIPAGTLVQYYSMAEDVDSQRRRGKIELDELGNPTDGVHEYVINDPSLASVQAVYLRAHAEIAVYKDPIITVKYATRNRTRPGARVTVNLTNPPCSGRFLVQSVVIDQIRDEGDQLAPRYTIVASTVLYDLTNFLLLLTGGNQISGGGSSSQSSIQGGGGSSSQVGVQEAAVSQVSSLSSPNSPLTIPSLAKGFFNYAAYSATNSGWSLLIGSFSNSFAGTTSLVVDTRGIWSRQTSGAVVGNNCGFAHTNTFSRLEFNCGVQFYCRTGPSLSNMRLWWGAWCQGNNAVGNNTTPFFKTFGAKMNTVVGDAGLVLFYWNGTTMTVSPNALPLAVNTEYLVTIQSLAGGTQIGITLVDSAGNTFTDTLAVDSASFALMSGIDGASQCHIYTNEAVAKRIDFHHISFFSGLN